jgi:chromosome segregation ATPase
MARPGVTYLDVANAAQQLVAAGRMPTIETIRIALGTGSNSTLGNHLRTWKSKQDQTQQIATKENIPEELIAALKGVWERVIVQSDEKIQAVQQETQQELMQLKHDVQRLQKDNTVLQQQYQQIKQERDGFAHEKSAVEQLLANAKIEIATLTGKQAGLEQQNLEKQTRIDELNRQNKQVQGNLEHYRNASLEQRLADQQRYEQQQKQLEQTIQQANQELAQLRHEKLVLQQQHQQTIFENGSLKTQFDKINAQHESISTRLTDTLSELAKKTQDQQHWKDRFKTLQTTHDEQNQSFIEMKTQHAMLLQQSETIKTELIELREQNKVLAHEKWVLGQEKAQLYGQVKAFQEVA